VIVRLFKPEVFKGRAVPSIEIRRSKEWCQLPVLTVNEPGVRVEVLNQTSESGAYRVHLAQGARWAVPEGMSCIVISGRARAGDRDVLKSDRLAGKAGRLQKS
jgi:hypothetical protein